MDRTHRRGISRPRPRPSLAAIAHIEALESRALLAGMVTGSWPGPHELDLTLDNGGLAAPGSPEDLTINAAQYAAGGGKAIFSGAIIGVPGAPFHGTQAELRFLKVPDTSFTRVTDFTADEPSRFPGRTQVGFGGATLALDANRINLVKVTAIRPGFPFANPFSTLPDGDLRILVDTIAPTVQSVGPVDSPRATAVSTVAVALSEPVQAGEFTFADLALSRDGAPVALDSRVTVAEVSGTPGLYQVAGLAPFTGAPGSYELTVAAGGLLDVAGNPGAGSASARFTVNPNLNVPPAPPAPDLQAASDTGFSPTDNITAATALAFDLAGVDPSATVQLLRDGVVIGSRTGPGPVVDPAAPGGAHAYAAAQVGPAGVVGPPSTALAVVVDAAAPAVAVGLDPTQATFSGQENNPASATTERRPRLIVAATDAPANPANVLFASLVSIDGQAPAVPTAAPPALPGQAIAPLTVPSDLAAGPHLAVVQVADAAGNVGTASLAFTVLANPSLNAPGTPVFSTIYDLNQVESILNASEGVTPDGEDDERPWTISFDRTTQTMWAVVRGQDINHNNTTGNRLVQLDPATGRLRAWSLQDLDPNSGPHGIFFDFESHLTPRVWFTQRTGDQTGNTHAGRVSYLDLATDRIVTYDVRQMLIDRGYTGPGGKPLVGDLHAIFVDRRGVVWVSDESDQLLLELDFRGGEAGLASTQGSLTVHTLPPIAVQNESQITAPGGQEQENVAGPHGIEVVINDEDDSPLVYFTTIVQGRFNVLKPAAAGGQDQWYSWNVDDLIRQELGLGPNDPAIGAPLFPTVDTNETPGNPADDRVFFGDPGFPRTIHGKTTSNNVIRELDPGNLVLDPNAASSPITSWHLPAIPGTPAAGGGLPATPLAQVNQTYVDREGNVFYIDRRGGVGRLDVAAAPGMTYQAPIERKVTAASATIPLKPVDRPASEMVRLADAIVPPNFTLDPKFARPEDLSGLPGLDQYLVQGPASPNLAQGSAGFRGTLSAGSIVFASLTQGDLISSTVFAEEARRETAVVVGPGDARKAFQVQRDGRVIVTEHDNGSLVDRQRVLTRSDASGAAIDPLIRGDVAAVRDASGVTHVFGRDETGGLAEYVLDPVTGAWSSRLLGRAASPLAGNPQAFLDPIRGAAAFATTETGHLIAFYADNGQVVDLTALAGAGDASLVYSKVGVAEANGLVYAYGTNQRGDVIEYALAPGGASATARRLDLPQGNRDLMVFQDLEAVAVGGTRHVFGTDGASRLIHVTIRPDGTATAENVTELTKDLATGYSAYQQPYAARVYGGANAVVAPDGQIFVYGTNGRDLVEFRLAADGTWSATNLTNRPANRVFGNPSAYILPNGDRHILMINEDGEMVEYYKLAGLDFATVNLTLAQGNDTTSSPPAFPNNLPGSPQPAPASGDDHADLPGFAASPLAFNPAHRRATIAGRIGAAGDRDVFRLVAPRSGRIVVDLAAVGRGPDLVLTALNGSTRRLARNDNARRRTTDSRVTLDVVAGRTYYLVASARNGQTGDYTLSLHYVGAAGPVQPARVPDVPVSTTISIGEAAPTSARPWTKARRKKG